MVNQQTNAISVTEATRVLGDRDPVIARLARETGPVGFAPEPISNFEALVRGIVYQQLAGPAARAIYGRLTHLLRNQVTADQVMSCTEAQLREAGLSRAKSLSLLDLAQKVEDGTVPIDDQALATTTDSEIEKRLVSVRGIGPWTAQTFMMIHLLRMDILPVGDLGIRKGYGLAWGKPVPTEKELLAIGEPLRPYRSIFSWYCWRALERGTGANGTPVTGR